jgi:hypothetical protein
MSAGPAQAGLLGATVNVSGYYPDSDSLYLDPGDAVVSGAVEYPQGIYGSYGSVAVDITDTQLIIDDQIGNALPFADAEFNGFILRVLSGPQIATASVDPASNFSPVEVSVIDGDLLLNFQGVSEKDSPGRYSIINFTTVPEPGPGLLMGLGLVGLGLAGRHGPSRRRS